MTVLNVLRDAIINRARSGTIDAGHFERSEPRLQAFREGDSTQKAAEAAMATERDLPEACLSLVVGYHCLLLGDLGEDPDPEACRQVLIRYLNKAALDRSFLGPMGDDLLLILVGPPGSHDHETWWERQQVIERDARVCRKLVWLPPAKPESMDASAADFLGRTFLARPFKDTADNTTELDRLAKLAEHIVPAGLTAGEAQVWIELLSNPDPADDLLKSLVDALEETP
ncbi:MAG: hypothetical protein WCZ23_05385 [Rhodospirillaceae bacterium]